MSTKPVGKFLPKDKDGFILNDTDVNKILPDFLPVISKIKKIIIDGLSESMHSIYLTGSIPRGVAKPYKSDVDIFYIFWNLTL